MSTPIKKEVLDLSEAIQKTIVIDKKAGTIGLAEGATPYIDNLPEGLSADIVSQVNSYNMLFGSASAHAGGNKIIDLMAAKKDLPKATLTIPAIGKDAFNVTTTRSRTFGTGDDQVTKFGYTRVSLDFYGMGNRGDMGKVLNELSEKADKLLAD